MFHSSTEFEYYVEGLESGVRMGPAHKEKELFNSFNYT